MRFQPLVSLCLVVLSLGTLCAQVSAPRLSGVSGGGAVDPGQRVVLSPVFIGAAPQQLQYVWRKNGVELSGEVASTLAIGAIVASDGATYTVVASNSGGSSSASTEITVRADAAPLITMPPRAITVEAGQNALFNFTATGSFPRTFQWRKDGVNLPGATNATFLLRAVDTVDVGAYSVQVSNSLGTVVSASAGLTVTAARPPVLDGFPREIGPAIQGRRETITAPVSSGSTPLTYQWRKEGVAIAGATDSTLVFDGISFADTGVYSVVVTNVAGTAASQDMRITVEPAPPPFKIRLSDPGALVGFSFELLDTSSLFETQPTTFQWYKEGRPIPQATTLRYHVPRAGIDTSGDYFVVATNVSGSTTSSTARVSTKTRNGPFDSPWKVAAREGDVVYFIFANPARIERFDLASDGWLTAIGLSRPPTAMTVHRGGLYVAFGPVISRFALDGTAESSVTAGFRNEITELCVRGGFLFAMDNNGEVTTVRLSDGSQVSMTRNSLYQPVVVAESTGVLLGRTSSHSGQLVAMKILADGSLQRLDDRANLSDLPYGTRLFLAPDELRTVSEVGPVFDTASLELVGSLGDHFDDVGWTASRESVVLRAGTLHFYATNLHETRRLVTDIAGRRLFIRGGDAFIFGSLDTTGRPEKKRVALAQAQTLGDPAPLSPERLGFTPDTVLVDRNGVVLLYSKLHRQIFRWSTAERRFIGSISVRDWLDHIAYSEANHLLYLGHSDGRVSQVRLEASAPAAEPFVTVSPPIRNLAVAGEYLWVNFSSFSSFSSTIQLIFDRDARQVHRGVGYSADYTWSPAKRRMYHFRDSPNNLLYTEIKMDGTAGVRRDSPYHGEISTISPIRVSADGSRVLLGSGKIFDGDSLAVVNSLPFAIQDAQWVGSRVVTARVTARGIEVQRWSGANFDLDRTTVLPGRLVALLALLGERVGVVTVINGLVHISTLDQELGVVSTDFVGEPQRLANLSSRAWVGRGDQTLIPGFVITGSDPKTVLIRASGPALTDFGVAGAIADPSFTVHNGAGAVIAANDNWWSGTNTSFLRSVSSRVGAFGLGRSSRDAAALMTLEPGSYTVQVRGAGDSTGVALVEVYDGQDNQGAGRLVNIATRAFVGSGDDILIAGVVVQTDRPKAVLIRAVGPSLAPFGVADLLANPRLRVFRDGQMIAENDEWGHGGASTTEQITLAATRTGAFSLLADSQDSALVLELSAGAYSVQVSGVGGTTGVALVEIYEIP